MVMVVSPHLNNMCFFLFFHQVKLAGQALGQAVDAGEGGLSVETLLRALHLQWWDQIFLIHYKFIFLDFEQDELSL